MIACTCGHVDAQHEAPEGQTAGRCLVPGCWCAAYTEQGSMRVMRHRGCAACGYDWQAPSDKGNCPRCHSDQTMTGSVRNNHLRRV